MACSAETGLKMPGHLPYLADIQSEALQPLEPSERVQRLLQVFRPDATDSQALRQTGAKCKAHDCGRSQTHKGWQLCTMHLQSLVSEPQSRCQDRGKTLRCADTTCCSRTARWRGQAS